MANDRRVKDKTMAAYLKAKHITRTTGQCGICHATIGLGAVSLISHITSRCTPRIVAKRNAVNARRSTTNPARDPARDLLTEIFTGSSDK